MQGLNQLIPHPKGKVNPPAGPLLIISLPHQHFSASSKEFYRSYFFFDDALTARDERQVKFISQANLDLIFWSSRIPYMRTRRTHWCDFELKNRLKTLELIPLESRGKYARNISCFLFSSFLNGCVCDISHFNTSRCLRSAVTHS